MWDILKQPTPKVKYKIAADLRNNQYCNSMFNIPVWTYVWTLMPAEHLKYVNLKFTRMKNEINSQSLEDTQVEYI